jgi:hypothetical protein
LAAAAASQSGTFWAPAELSAIPEAYRFVLHSLVERRQTIAAAAIIALAAAGAALARHRHRTAAWHLPAHEVVAGLTTLAIPLVGVVLGVYVTGTFTPRYAMPLAVGVSLVLPIGVRWINPAGGLAEVILCLLLSFSFGTSVYDSLREPHGPFPDPFTTRPLLVQAVQEPGPVAIAGRLQFVQFWYYAPSELRSRIVYLADPEASVRFRGTDTVDRGYLALARWTPVTVERYAEFVDRHDSFRVYTGGSGWLLDKLRKERWTLDQLGRERGGELYLAHRR